MTPCHRGTQFAQQYFDTAVPAVAVEKKMLYTDSGSILMCFEAERKNSISSKIII
jgi:hypothetical protein